MKEISVPDNFPIQWEKTEDKTRSWIQDEMHAPVPFTPMARSLSGDSMAHGYNQAFKILKYPLKCEVKIFNTYYYLTLYPTVTPKEFAEKSQESEEALEQFLSTFRNDWYNKFLPQVIEHTDFMEKINLKTSSMTVLINHFSKSIERMRKLWEIHFINVVPMMVAPSLFQEFYKDLFPEATDFEALELLEGFEDDTTRMEIEFWRLSREAMKDKNIELVLRKHPPEAIVGALQMSKAGWDYLAKIQEVLENHGKRCETALDFTHKSWLEDLEKPIKNIQDCLLPEAHDVGQHIKETRKLRDQKLAQVRKKIENFPAMIRNRFEMLLDAAVTASVLQEDHNYVLDQRMIYLMRKILFEIGRRFVLAQAIDHEEEILYLFPEEILEAVERLPEVELRPQISKRKSEMEYFAKISPPSIIGAEPEPFPVESSLNVGITKFFGGPLKPSADSHVLIGNAASPGIVRGTARIVKDLEDAKRIQPGDILVTKTTSPVWTPLFGAVKAVVTNIGGVLCHCAIVAREYGIPAVLGIHNATVAIKDGDLIEVNGDTGTVTITSTSTLSK